MMFFRYLLVTVLFLSLGWIAPAAQAQTATGAAQGVPGTFQELVMDIQRMLTELGYRPGPIDGKPGNRTRQAIRRYQSNTGLAVDGHPSQALHQHLRVTTGAAAPSATVQDAAAGTTEQRTERKAAWQGRVVSAALLRIAPSGASASRQTVAKGTRVDVVRRQGSWLEVRLEDSGAEGWMKQTSVRPITETKSTSSEKAKSGGFFASLARGVSRLLGGTSDAPQDQGTVTVGIRGLAPEDLASTIPDPGEVEEMESYRADQDHAFRFAAQVQLTTQSIEYLQPAGATTQSPSASGRRED
jgi:peptidoglycan hydrolase-like protein with peptidoglycan-binding domain